MAKTLREKLNSGGKLVVDISDAPSFLHDWDFGADDDIVTFSWEDAGLDYAEPFDLDATDGDVRVFRLEEVL